MITIVTLPSTGGYRLKTRFMMARGVPNGAKWPVSYVFASSLKNAARGRFKSIGTQLETVLNFIAKIEIYKIYVKTQVNDTVCR